jgi:hypothetical protein
MSAAEAPFPQVTSHPCRPGDVPSTGLEPVAYRLGGRVSVALPALVRGMVGR